MRDEGVFRGLEGIPECTATQSGLNLEVMGKGPSGGFGQVYFQDGVAYKKCKLSTPTQQESFRREWTYYQHVKGVDGLVQYIDMCRFADVGIITMPRAKTDLLDWTMVEREEGDRLDMMWKVVEQIRPALDSLHRLGYCHCDVKPDNILLAQDGTLQLTDFGHMVPATVTNQCVGVGKVGTLAYVPPAEMLAKAIPTHLPLARYRDQWGYGVTLYMIAFGQNVPWVRAQQTSYYADYKLFQQFIHGLRTSTSTTPTHVDLLFLELYDWYWMLVKGSVPQAARPVSRKRPLQETEPGP
jgi:serine/threonine protein kinase